MRILNGAWQNRRQSTDTVEEGRACHATSWSERSRTVWGSHSRTQAFRSVSGSWIGMPTSASLGCSLSSARTSRRLSVSTMDRTPRRSVRLPGGMAYRWIGSPESQCSIHTSIASRLIARLLFLLRDLGPLERQVVHEALLAHHESHDRLVYLRGVDRGPGRKVHQHHRPIPAPLPAIARLEVLESLVLQEHDDDVFLLRPELNADGGGRNAVIRHGLAADAQRALAIFAADAYARLDDIREHQNAPGGLEELPGSLHLLGEPVQHRGHAGVDLLGRSGRGHARQDQDTHQTETDCPRDAPVDLPPPHRCCLLHCGIPFHHCADRPRPVSVAGEVPFRVLNYHPFRGVGAGGRWPLQVGSPRPRFLCPRQGAGGSRPNLFRTRDSLMPLRLRFPWIHGQSLPDGVRAGRRTISPEQRADYVRRMFSAIAPRYDLTKTVISAGLHLPWKRRTVGAPGPAPAPPRLPNRAPHEPAVRSGVFRCRRGGLWAAQRRRPGRVPSGDPPRAPLRRPPSHPGVRSGDQSGAPRALRHV